MSIFYAGELNPVAAKAQKKVPVPEGLDLDAWINDPPMESDEADEDEADEESDDDDAEDGYNELVQRTPSPSDKKKKKKTKKEKKRRKKSNEEAEYDVEQARQNRLLEQSMNPNYLKVRPKK